jgi:hypothetical protein
VGNDGGYTWHIVQKTKAWQMFQNWWLLKRIHINLMGQLQCIYNPSRVKSSFNLGYPYSLSSYNWNMTLSITIFNSLTQCVSIVLKNYFKPRVNAPISDNKRLNSLDFRQRTPYQSNNAHNVYGSKNHAYIKTNTLIYLNSIN